MWFEHCDPRCRNQMNEVNRVYWMKHGELAKMLSARQGTGSSALSGTDSAKEAAWRMKIKSQYPDFWEKAKSVA